MDVITARGVANADSYDRLQHGNSAGQVVDWRPQSKCGAPAGNRSAAATQPVQAEGGQVIVPGSSFSHPSLSKATSVYLYYDAADRLIYVGITNQGPGRAAQHAKKAEWWPYATRTVLEHYGDRLTAARRESELIRGHRPPFNKQGNARWKAERTAYLAERAIETTNGQHPALALAESLRFFVPFKVLGGEGQGYTFRSSPHTDPITRRIQTGPYHQVPVKLQEGAEAGTATSESNASGRLWSVHLLEVPACQPSCIRLYLDAHRHPQDPEFRVGWAEISFDWPAPWKVAA